MAHFMDGWSADTFDKVPMHGSTGHTGAMGPPGLNLSDMSQDELIQQLVSMQHTLMHQHQLHLNMTNQLVSQVVNLRQQLEFATTLLLDMQRKWREQSSTAVAEVTADLFTAATRRRVRKPQKAES